MERKKKTHRWFQHYILDGLSAMAMGLFASLIVGLIVKTMGEQIQVIPYLNALSPSLIQIGQTAMSLMGAAIGAAMAYKWKAPFLVLLASMVSGALGATLGGPAGAYLAVVIGVEVGQRISKKTPLDIIVTPMATIVSGYLMAITGGQLIGLFMTSLGLIITEATQAQPLFMGIIIAVIMGMALTAPISSAALAMMLGLSGLAAGAATAGCCAQMIGFAMMSRKENPMGMIVAQGLGTSMLQISNILKNPWIWVPPIVTSAITGGLTTVVFKMENVAAGAGMGTSGLVGPLLTLTTMGFTIEVVRNILILYIFLPTLLSVLFYELLKKVGKIKVNDCYIPTE